MLGRVFAGFFGAAFVLSAVVQYNDPDWVPWVVVYLCAATLCALQPTRRVIGLSAILGLGALVWAGVILPEAMAVTGADEIVAAMAPDRPQTEAAREVGGLLLVVVWAVLRTFGLGSAA